MDVGLKGEGKRRGRRGEIGEGKRGEGGKEGRGGEERSGVERREQMGRNERGRTVWGRGEVLCGIRVATGARGGD